MVKSGGFFLLLLALAVFIYSAYRSYALRDRNNGDVVAEPQDGSPAVHRDAAASAVSGKSPAAASIQTAAPGDAASAPNTAIPATDSIAPNPPNGVAFGRNGHFQVYRQGDITWRLNTVTGTTCVLFATDAQWRQPRIRHAACRNSER